MIVAGLQKTSLIDYPGKVSCVLFLPGCNFECPYCHNPDLVNMKPWQGPSLSSKMVYDFLENRRDFLDGIVISGGEPTLQNDLVVLCRRIKEIGYPIKLDTNGSRPQVIKLLLAESLLDYIAMDVKTSPFHYAPVIAKSCNPKWILSSIETIMGSNVDYEFRSTCVRPILNERAIDAIAKTIRGARRYILQRFRNHMVLKPDYFKKTGSGYEEHELLHLKAIAEPWVCQCSIR